MGFYRKRSSGGYIDIEESRESGSGEDGERLCFKEHRLLAIAHYGTQVAEKVIHHKNGIKFDNRIKNLEPMSNEEHSRLHTNERIEKGDFPPKKYTEEELKKNLKNIIEEIDTTLKLRIFKEKSDISREVYRNRYSSINQAKEKFGLGEQTTQGQLLSNSEIKDEVRNLWEDLGHKPRKKDIKNKCDFGYHPINQRWSGISEFRQKLQEETDYLLPTSTKNANSNEKEDLIEDLKQAAEKVEGTLTQSDYTKYGEHSVSSVQNNLGSWSKGKEKADVE